MSLVDTHAHFCEAKFNEDRQAALKRAYDNQVRTVIEIADGPEGWAPAQALVESVAGQAGFPLMYWTCGFHPHYAESAAGFNFDLMRQAAANANCVAIGEIGLDYFKSTAAKDTQMQLFRQALEVAAGLNKPVVIHCREAQADTLRILRSFYSGVSRRDLIQGVIHCFSGDAHFAEACLDLGFLLGVDGPITYPNSQNLREVIAQVPLEKIVLETDAPYLPPQLFRGQRNESAYLPHVAEKLAELFKRPTDEIARVTSANAKKLYRIL